MADGEIIHAMVVMPLMVRSICSDPKNTRGGSPSLEYRAKGTCREESETHPSQEIISQGLVEFSWRMLLPVRDSNRSPVHAPALEHPATGSLTSPRLHISTKSRLKGLMPEIPMCRCYSMHQGAHADRAGSQGLAWS